MEPQQTLMFQIDKDSTSAKQLESENLDSIISKQSVLEK